MAHAWHEGPDTLAGGAGAGVVVLPVVCGAGVEVVIFVAFTIATGAGVVGMELRGVVVMEEEEPGVPKYPSLQLQSSRRRLSSGDIASSGHLVQLIEFAGCP